MDKTSNLTRDYPTEPTQIGAKQEPRIWVELGNQDKLVSNLAAKVINLKERLQPVLTPAPEADSGVPENDSSVGSRIATNSAVISRLSAEIDDLIDRLEV